MNVPKILFVLIILLIVGCQEKQSSSGMTIPKVEDVHQENKGATPEQQPVQTTPKEESKTAAEPVKDVTLPSNIHPIEVDVDLKNFPELFLGEKNGKTVSNVLIVVGKQAPARDIIAATTIASALNELVETENDRVKTVLDDEVSNLYDQNVIIIGNPCDNPQAKELTRISDCHADLKENQASITLFDEKNHIQLSIVGYDGQGTLKAAQKITDKKSLLSGKVFIFSYS